MDNPINKVKVILLALMLSAALPLMAQDNFSGAWQGKQDGHLVQILFQDGYYVETHYTPGEFLFARGGWYKRSGDALQVNLEFDSENSGAAGSAETITLALVDNLLEFSRNGQTLRLRRVDKGTAPLAGVWHITQRMQEGKLVPIHRSGTRKTLKVLTGTRFQWFAIDPGKGMFGGTGGGRYEFRDGVYTEHIDFFSRDNSRVGNALNFEGSLQDGHWHHRGLSSKGDPIYEVWSKVRQ